MYARQWSMGRGVRTQDDERIVIEPCFHKWAVYRGSIGSHRGAGLNVFTHEWYERSDGRGLDTAQPNTPESFRLEHFNRHCNCNQVRPVEGLGANPFAPHPGASSQRQVRFIHLHRPAQQVPVRAHHRTPKSVQHGPSSLVAIKPQHTLQAQGTDALLLTSEIPRCREPHAKWCTGFLEDRSGRHAALMSATSADQPAPRGATGRIEQPAGRTVKSMWPSQVLQVRRAHFIIGKPVLELAPRCRIVPAGNRLDGVHSAIVDLVELNG